MCGLLVINIQLTDFTGTTACLIVSLIKHVKLPRLTPRRGGLEHAVRQVTMDCHSLPNPHYALNMQNIARIFISQFHLAITTDVICTSVSTLLV